MKRILILALFFIPSLSYAATVYEFSPTGGQILHGFGSASQGVAQSFVVPSDATGTNATLYVQLYHGGGDGSAHVTAFVFSDNGDTPVGGSVVTNSDNAIASTDLPGECGAIQTFNFTSYAFAPGTKYWLVLESDTDYDTDQVVNCGSYAGGNGDSGIVFPGNGGVIDTFASDGGSTWYHEFSFESVTPTPSSGNSSSTDTLNSGLVLAPFFSAILVLLTMGVVLLIMRV